VLAAMLDEGLAVLAGLWSGEPFSFRGEHYTVEECVFWPRPHQEPCIPVWVGGFWPNKPPFRQAARWDGVYPLAFKEGEVSMTPRIFAEVVALVRRHRTGDGPFDFVASGWTSPNEPDEAARLLPAYAAAGATWFLEAADEFRAPLDAMRERIRRGPPCAWERRAWSVEHGAWERGSAVCVVASAAHAPRSTAPRPAPRRGRAGRGSGG
jgi:alkanesulfonate monooxygenase SsuD/methylene tetrahydromethanopterin reductase-like flavin-dependent oxidoreductase (luciferase family)